MNKLAIVGSSKINYDWAFDSMKVIITQIKPDIIISGDAKGIDSLAETIGRDMNIELEIHPPKTNNWKGYKERNIIIAKNCDELYNFVIKDKDSYCYHHKCKGHIKSGGCWTQNYAKQLGKKTELILISLIKNFSKHSKNSHIQVRHRSNTNSSNTF